MARATRVSIEGDGFRINDRPTYEGRSYQGHKIEGLLPNSRMFHRPPSIQRCHAVWSTLGGEPANLKPGRHPIDSWSLFGSGRCVGANVLFSPHRRYSW